MFLLLPRSLLQECQRPLQNSSYQSHLQDFLFVKNKCSSAFACNCADDSVAFVSQALPENGRNLSDSSVFGLYCSFNET